jgi:hypothetical protein
MLVFSMMAVVCWRANSLNSHEKQKTKLGLNAGAMVCSRNPSYGHTPPATPDRAAFVMAWSA